MLKNFLYSILFSICLLVFSACSSSARYDPLSVPNNRIGIHILDTSEIFSAAKLVNSSGGDWGYVTIPIRSDDRDFDKWFAFFKNCTQLHLIPIVRLATYPDNQNWVEPTIYDLQDFANFLNLMPWPVQNRYLVLFNEPNHAKEWGGGVNPRSYGQILADARQIFTHANPDYFLLTAGLDMSAPTNHTSLSGLEFYRLLSAEFPQWFKNIDGITVHAYPNPGFVADPLSSGRFGPKSYRFELAYLKSIGYIPQAVFITETGYLGSKNFYSQVLNRVWTEKNIAAVTPFVLSAHSFDFSSFSFLDSAGNPKSAYLELQNYPKLSGQPLIASPEAVLIPNTAYVSSAGTGTQPASPNIINRFLALLGLKKHRLSVGSAVFDVEVVSKFADQARGLSGRPVLLLGSGMLFAYSDSQIRTFWMKDMNFALDFVWINQNRVVNIHHRIPPPAGSGSTPALVSSLLPVDQVLELPAGEADTSGIGLGDYVKLIY